MKRELTWKRLFLTILGAVLLVVAAGLTATLSIGHKASTINPVPFHASLLTTGTAAPIAGVLPSGSGWVLTTAGLELTPDGGNSFTFVPYPIPVLNISDVVIKGSHVLVAGVINSLPVLKSSNDVGATWKSVALPAGSGNAGFARFVTRNGTLIGMLVTDVTPFSVAEWYATSDGGATWTHHSIPSGGVVTAAGGDLWLAGGPQFASLYKSADLGVTWSRVSTPFGTLNDGPALSVPGQLKNGNVVLVATIPSESLTPIVRAKVYISSDHGAHWKVLAETNFVGKIGSSVAVAASVVANRVWLGGATDQGIAVISTKGALTKTSSMRAVYSGGWITSIMPFGNSSAWVTTVNGKCLSGKSSCTEVGALIGTLNGGKTWSLVDLSRMPTSPTSPRPSSTTGAYVIASQFDAGNDFAGGLARVRIGAKWGFIDKTGHYVVKPQFDDAHDFVDGLARVQVGKKFGFIDRTGKYAIPSRFDFVMDFADGLAVVERGTRWGYIDKTGKYVITPQFDGAMDFDNGIATVQMGVTLGYIDKTGKYLITPQFGGASKFVGGLALVESGGKFIFIDKTGKYVIAANFDGALPFEDGLALVEIGPKTGYIDKTGKYVIAPIFTSAANNFAEGLAVIQDGSKFGYIDKTGKYVVQPQFDAAYDFADGLATVNSGGKFGYINKTGKYAITPQFAAANSFASGLARVKIETKWGYINKTGKIAINPQFDSVNNFADGLALVQSGTKWGYITHP